MSNNLKFSEQLQIVHQQSQKVITFHIQRLDSISNDIKALETVLKESAIPFNFYYRIYSIGSESDWDGRNFSIAWEDKRLYYIEWQRDGFDRRVDVKTPLVEAKAKIRLSVGDELPSFYKMLINALKSNWTISRHLDVSVDSPNYEREINPF